MTNKVLEATSDRIDCKVCAHPYCEHAGTQRGFVVNCANFTPPKSNSNSQAREWIPVTERLPQFDQKVLCYKKGEIKIGQYIGARYTGEIYAFRTLDMYMAFGATHWMPLPEPPKEVE